MGEESGESQFLGSLWRATLSRKAQPFEFAGELANWFVNWFGELAVRSVSEFALDGIPLVRCIGSVVRPWVPEPSN